MDIKERAAYLKGMMSAMDFDSDDKESKLFNGIVDLLSEMAGSIENLEEDMDEVCEQIADLDDDISKLHCSCDKSCNCDCDDCNCTCDCGCDCNHGDNEDYEDEYEDNDDFYELTCPECNEKICLDSDSDEEIVKCPNCGERLDFDFEDFADDYDQDDSDEDSCGDHDCCCHKNK